MKKEVEEILAAKNKMIETIKREEEEIKAKSKKV